MGRSKGRSHGLHARAALGIKPYNGGSPGIIPPGGNPLGSNVGGGAWGRKGLERSPRNGGGAQGLGNGIRAQIRLHMRVIVSAPTEGAGSRAGILVGDLWGIIGGGHGEGGGGRDPSRFPGDPWGRRRRMGGTYMSFCINHCICMSTLLRKDSH